MATTAAARLTNTKAGRGARRLAPDSRVPAALGAAGGTRWRRCILRRYLRWCVVMSCACSAPDVARHGGVASSEAASSEALPSTEPLLPVPLDVAVDIPLATLGQALFFSPVLSQDGRVSCGSCHAADRGFADGKPLSEIPERPRTATNSQSLFNVRFFYRLGWTGRFESLDAHLDFLIKNPKLMGTDWSKVVARLAASTTFKAHFDRVFSDGVSENNARRALIEFERSLVTPNAPFDRWLRGDKRAISPSAERGYQLFKNYGCSSCHQGMAVGANMFERLGVMRDYFRDHPSTSDADLGRFSVTRREEDRYVFRVPSLRNVALSAPYLHDGSAATLQDAVSIMARYQLGRDLAPGEVAEIVAFLESLTGEYRGLPP